MNLPNPITREFIKSNFVTEQNSETRNCAE